jgi:hypothetical protein
MSIIQQGLTYPVHSGLDVAAGEEAEGVAGVHGQAAVEGLGPLPVAGLVVADLQGGDGLAEQQRDGAEVRMAAGPEPVGQLLDLLVGELGVLHVPQVRLVVRLPPVHLGEEVRRQLQRQRDQVVEGIQDLVVEILPDVIKRQLRFIKALMERVVA